MKKYSTHIIWLIIAIVALGGGFFWGKAGGTAARGGFAGASAYNASSSRRFASGGAGAGGGMTSGQIATIDASSITLQLANGNSQVVFYSTSTPVSEPTMVSPSTLKVGTTIVVGGTTNSDGSLTAQTIQVRTDNATGAGAPAAQ